MKSRNLKAIFAAFSAAAILATATTGFAATVNTTADYDFAAGKVAVTAVISNAAAGEVTYVLKANDKVAYIDQQTATGADLEFDYVVDEANLANLTGEVTLASNVDQTWEGVKDIAVSAPVAPILYQVGSEKEAADGALKSVTTLLKVAGNPAKYGVVYDGKRYPALSTATGYSAIKLVFEDGSVVSSASVTPYMIDAEGNVTDDFAAVEFKAE